MNENLFQYLWKHSLFHPSNLRTTQGDAVTVLSPGILNTDSGPDFKEGRIKINDTIWVGNIELHLKSSDWEKHNHQNDENYSNIILHVVYEDDSATDKGNFPTVELKAHLKTEVIDRYQHLVSRLDAIPCHDQLDRIPEIIWESWINRLLAERWEGRLREWEHLWNRSKNDWRSLLYLRMAANFGFHTNSQAFLDLALSLPLNLLARHRDNLFQLEALLFGQSGLLMVEGQDDYTMSLEKEYNFLRRKYELEPLAKSRWKFMRMRPSNFPTIRIAQFAMLLHTSLDLFSKMMEVKAAEELYDLLDFKTSAYWENHYRFSETSKRKSVKRLGRDAVNNLIINTVAPMQFLYSRLLGKTDLQASSIELLQSLPAEDNNITRAWKQRGVVAKDASESQALIQLLKNYCEPRNCLQCSVGHHLLRGHQMFNPK